MATLHLEKIKWGFWGQKERRPSPLYSLPKESSVLDVSCGDANMLAMMHYHGPSLKLHGIDISEQVIQQVKNNYSWGEFVVARAEELPYAAGSFDSVISSMSLHHYAKPKEVFAEISRVLSPNGKFYLIDFIAKYRWSQWLNNLCGCHEHYHFEKYYTKQDIKTLVQSVGFSITDERKVGTFTGQKLFVIEKAG